MENVVDEMESMVDEKGFTRGVKALRDKKVAEGMEKNAAFTEAIREFSNRIITICDLASQCIRPVS